MQPKSSNSPQPSFFTPLLVVIPTAQDIQETLLSLLTNRFSWSSPSLDHQDIVWVNPVDAPLSIDHVRLLPSLTSSQPASLQRFLILPNFSQASLPAQNALLKILEEPPAQHQFILVTSNIEKVLPTIKSRVLQITDETSANSHYLTAEQLNETSKLYLQVTASTFAQLIDIAENYPDRQEAQALIRHLISYLHHQLTTVSNSSEGLHLTQHLQHLLKAQELLDKNVNVRLVLEDVFFQMKKNN